MPGCHCARKYPIFFPASNILLSLLCGCPLPYASPVSHCKAWPRGLTWPPSYTMTYFWCPSAPLWATPWQAHAELLRFMSLFRCVVSAVLWERLWASAFPFCKRRQLGQVISSVQSLSRAWLFATPWTATHQASLSITSSWSLLKRMSFESVMPSNHLVLRCPLLLIS